MLPTPRNRHDFWFSKRHETLMVMARKAQEITVEGRRIAVTNLDKELYPGGHYTKGEIINYYVRVAPFLLPHIKDRPVTLKRFPNGVSGEFFYEKDAPSFTPDWVQTFPVPRRTGRGGQIQYILINDLPTLVWSANLANLEIHPFLHRVPNIDRPTMIVFDLDPGEGADVVTCARVAIISRDLLQELGLKSFAKVSGSKGIQLYVPLNTPTSYSETGPFAKAIAEMLEQRNPDLVLSDMSKSRRRNKVFVDWSQNSDFKTTISVYSLRAKTAVPYVSLPVGWDELQKAIDADDAKSLYFTPGAALERLEKVGDLFEPVLKLKQRLPDLAGKSAGKRQRTPPLDRYSEKRDFSKTKEPAPSPVARSRQGSRRRFVIQKHAASHLHYDFRLEMHDVLKSWAVPKGPPYALNEKRLAMPTEDHPIEYLNFEGIIPKGQYGGGTVMVWDIGTYELIEGNYYKGYLHFTLEGKKLKGEWTLVKERDQTKWFLIKVGHGMRAMSAKRDDSSAVTNRSMAEIAKDRDTAWHSNRGPQPEIEGLPDAEMKVVEPMRAKPVAKLPDGSKWRYEVRLDGARTLAYRDGKGVMLRSEDEKNITRRFQQIADALRFLPQGTILDGEIVSLDGEGKPAPTRKKGHLYYYVFDLPAYRGKDLTGLSFRDRREILEKFALADIEDPIRVSGVFDTAPEDLIRVARQMGLNGIVGKNTESPYEFGRQTGAWVETRL
jgi:bifunctional non-homologous end joining protein LigD